MLPSTHCPKIRKLSIQLTANGHINTPIPQTLTLLGPSLYTPAPFASHPLPNICSASLRARRTAVGSPLLKTFMISLATERALFWSLEWVRSCKFVDFSKIEHTGCCQGGCRLILEGSRSPIRGPKHPYWGQQDLPTREKSTYSSILEVSTIEDKEGRHVHVRRCNGVSVPGNTKHAVTARFDNELVDPLCFCLRWNDVFDTAVPSKATSNTYA